MRPSYAPPPYALTTAWSRDQTDHRRPPTKRITRAGMSQLTPNLSQGISWSRNTGAMQTPQMNQPPLAPNRWITAPGRGGPAAGGARGGPGGPRGEGGRGGRGAGRGGGGELKGRGTARD